MSILAPRPAWSEPPNRRQPSFSRRPARGTGAWLVLLVTVLFQPIPGSAQDPGSVRTRTVPLWPDGAPLARGSSDRDIPAITLYGEFPDPGTTGTPSVSGRPAMVILPGGGYGGLAAHEGRDYALFLHREGFFPVVVTYRLGSAGYRHPVPLLDAARAVRWVRSQASVLGVDPARIGVMGSSAGGHLASTLLVRFDAGDPASSDPIDRVSSRPDFGILCYPVITMGSHTHSGSKRNLLGDNPSTELVEALSNERHVRATTPPVFLWHTHEDAAVPVENALLFAQALRREGVPFDLHIYTHGRHGIGLAASPPTFEDPHPWAKDLLFWLKARSILTASPASEPAKP